MVTKKMLSSKIYELENKIDRMIERNSNAINELSECVRELTIRLEEHQKKLDNIADTKSLELIKDEIRIHDKELERINKIVEAKRVSKNGKK